MCSLVLAIVGRLVELGTSQAEIRAIATKRRDFEYLLKRRSPRRVDFIRYIKYEMDLDEDRKRRKAALGV
jgi:U3 small nucleolar RNA-associated protein 6